MARKSKEISHEIKQLIVELNPPSPHSLPFDRFETFTSTGDEIWETLRAENRLLWPVRKKLSTNTAGYYERF